jgi:hypothetical protein
LPLNQINQQEGPWTDSPLIRVLEHPSTPPPQPTLEQPQSPGVDDVDAVPGDGAIGEAQQGFGSVQAFNSAAMEVALASVKGVTVQKVLLDMFQSGAFLCWGSNKIEDLALPLYIGREAAKMRSVLELVGIIVTPEEKACLVDKSSGLEAVKHVCQDLENKAMNKMQVLEKGVGAIGGRAKPYFTGLGKRVADYKKEKNFTHVGQVPGTPPGTRSIRSMFGAAQRTG